MEPVDQRLSGCRSIERRKNSVGFVYLKGFAASDKDV